MGGRAGIGPGTIIGAPMGALSTLGTAGRAGPVLAGWSVGRAGTGGPGGKLASLVYTVAKPFSKGEFKDSVQELTKKRQAQKANQQAVDKTKTYVIGTDKIFGKGQTRFTPGRGGQQDELTRKVNDTAGRPSGGGEPPQQKPPPKKPDKGTDTRLSGGRKPEE